MAAREHGWKTLEGAASCPLVRYIDSRGSRGSLVTIDREVAARSLGIAPASVTQELKQLANVGAVQYSADGSGLISVRVVK